MDSSLALKQAVVRFARGVVFAWFVALPATSAPLPLRNAQWLAPGSDMVAALVNAPAECFRRPADSGEAVLADAGRIVFRSPLLLGGPAARSGLSCDSCHVNGHANPTFYIAGLSSSPGTVDVTSSRFSATRGDGIFNPRRIPSLTEPVGTSPPSDRAAHLERFVHGVIVDEFQGWEPAPTVLSALLAYVSALDSDACPQNQFAPVRLKDDIALINSGVRSLDSALQRGDAALADFLLASLRSLLGSMHERFELPGLETPRAILIGLSGELGDLRELLPARPREAQSGIRAWQLRLHTDASALERFESRSLYDTQRLKAQIAEQSH